MAGYHLVYFGIMNQVNFNLASNLDNGNYSQNETITLRIPISIPYIPDSNEYERIMGDFEYQGEFYMLVQQKYEGDTLHVVCIKNKEANKLFAKMSAFVKQSTDASPPHSAAKLLNGFAKDYIPQNGFEMLPTEAGWNNSLLDKINFAPKLLAETWPVLAPPPRLV